VWDAAALGAAASIVICGISSFAAVHLFPVHGLLLRCISAICPSVARTQPLNFNKFITLLFLVLGFVFAIRLKRVYHQRPIKCYIFRTLWRVPLLFSTLRIILIHVDLYACSQCVQ